MSIRYAASPDPYAPSVVSGACSFPLQTQQQVFLDSASAASWEFMSRLSKPPPAFSTLGINVPSHAFTDPELWDTAFDRMSTQAMRPDDQVALMHKSSSALNGTAQGRTACCVRIMPSLKVVQTALRALGTNRRGASYEVWDSASARGQDDVASRVYMPNPTLWSIGGPGEHEVVVCDVLTGQRLLRIKDPKLDVQATALLHAPFRGLMDRKLRVLPVEKPTDLLRIKESQLICTDYVWIGFADGSIRLFPADHHKIRLSDRSAKMAKGEVADLVFELPKYHKASIASISRSPCHKDDEGTDLSTMNRLSSTIEYMTAATSGGSVTNREHLNLMCTASVDSSVVVWDIGKLYQALETLRNEKREEAAMARAGKGPLQSSATSAYTTDVISISGSGTNSSSFTVKSSCTLIKFRPLLRLKGGVAALKSLLWVSSLVTTANYRSWRDAVALSRDAEEPLAPKVVKERREVQELTEFEAREEQRHALRLSERGMKAVEEELKRLLPPLAPEPPQQLRVNLLIAGDNVGTVHMWNLDEELTRSTTELVVEHAASVSPTRPGVSPPRARPSTGRESTRSVSFSPPLMVNAVESPKPVRPPAKKKKAAAPPSPSTTAKHAGAGNASPRKTAAPKRGTAAPLVKSWASLSAASVPDKGMSQLELLAQQRKEGYFTAAASRRPETAGSASFLHSASLHKIPSVWGSSSVFSPQPTWDSALSSPQRRNLKTLGLHDSTSARGVPANRAHSPSPSMPHSARLAKAGSPSPRRAAEPASARRAAAPSPRLGEDGGKKSAHTRRIVSSPRRAPAAGTAVSSPRGPSTTPSGKKDKEKSTRSPSPAPLVPDSSASALVSSRSKGDVSSRGPKVEPERQRVTDYLSRTSRCRIEFTGGVGVTGMAADYPPVVRTTLRRIPDPEPRQISLLEEPTPAEVEQRQLENQFEDLTEEKAVFFVLQRLQLYLSVEGMVLNMRTVPIWTLPDGDKRQLFIQRQQKEEAHRAAEVAALVRPAHLQELVVDGGVALPAYTLQFRKIILEAHSQPVTHLFMDRRRRCVWVARNDGIMSLFSTDTKAILTRVPHPCADRALGPPPQGEWRRQQRNYIGGPNIISTSKVHLEWHRETIGYPSSYFNHVTPVCKRTQVAMLLVAVPGSTLEEDSRYEPSIMEYLGTTAYLNDLAASLEMTKVDGRSDMSDHARAREVQEGNFMNLLQYCRHRSNRVRRAHKEMFDVASGAVVVNIKSTLRASDRFNCIPLLRQCYRLWREHARHFRNLHLLRKQRAARLQITRHATAVYAQACEHHLRSQYFGKWLTRISQKRTEQRDQLLKGIWSTLRPPPPSVALRAILEHYLVRCRMQNAFRRWRAWYTKRSLSHRHPTFTQPNLLVRTKGDASSPNGSPMLKNVDGSNQPAFVTSFVDVLALIYDSRPFITRFRDSRAVTDSVYDEVWMAMIEGAGIEDDTPEVTKRVLVIRNGLVPLLQGLVSSAEDVLPSLHEDQVAADTLSLLSGIQLCLDFVTQDAEEVLLRVHQESCASPLGSPRRRNVGVEDADALLTSFYLLSPKEAAIRLLGVLMSDAALDAECSDSMKEIVREIISIETFMDFARDERTERFRELSTG